MIYESWVEIGCEFDPKKMLKKFTSHVPQESRLEKRYDPKTGKRLANVKVEVEEGYDLIGLVGRTFKIQPNEFEDDYAFEYEDILEEIAKAAKCRYVRAYKYDSNSMPSELVHAFVIKKESNGLDWILSHAKSRCDEMVRRLKELGLNVGKPKLVFGVDEN